MANRIGQIVVGYDYSAAGKAAVEAAGYLAERSGARVRVVTAMRGDSATPDIVSQGAERQRQEVLAVLSPDGIEPSFPLDLGVDRKPVIPALLDAAEADGSTLIVVGKRGLAGEGTDSPIGPDAERLARRSPYPVLVVDPDRPFPPNRILAAIDFSDASIRSLDWALEIARLGGGTVDALHVVDVGTRLVGRLFGSKNVDRKLEKLSAAKAQLVDFLHSREPSEDIAPKLRAGVPWQEIQAALQEEAYDMLCIATIGRHAITEALVGGTAERVIRNVRCSIVTAKPDGYGA